MLGTGQFCYGIKNPVDTSKLKACCLVITNISVASQVLNLTLMGVNILKFNGVMISVVGDLFVDSEATIEVSVHAL